MCAGVQAVRRPPGDGISRNWKPREKNLGWSWHTLPLKNTKIHCKKKKFGSDKPHPTFLSTASDGMDIKSSPSKRKFFSCDVADWGKSKREGSTPQRDSRVHEDALGLHGVGYDTPDAFSYCMGVLCVCMCITGTQ